MPDPTRRRVLFLGSAALAAVVMPGCDVLVLPQEDLLDAIEPITPTGDFYVYQYGMIPAVEESTWAVTLVDRGTEVATLTAADLDALEGEVFEQTLECIGSNPRLVRIDNARWEGAALADVLQDLGIAVDASVVEIVLSGADGYATSVPVSDLDAPMRLVWGMNDAPLPLEHGAPARLLIPGRYGTKNVKWVTRIELTDTPFVGYWEQRGWSNEASYLCNGLVLSPSNLAELPLGPVTFLGVAFAGMAAVTKVEVTTDDGATWQEATLEYAGGPNVWTTWSFDFDPPARGAYRLRLRVTASDGMVADRPDSTDSLQGYDGGMEVEVRFT